MLQFILIHVIMACTVGGTLGIIGTFITPKRKDIPEAAILMQTRKGAAVRYSPEQIAS